MHVISLTGYLVSKPDTRYVAGGKAVTHFTLIDNVSLGKGKDNQAVPFRCVLWGKVGENFGIQSQKGEKVQVFGTFRTNNYEKEEKKVFSYDLWVDRIDWNLNGKKAN